MKKLTAKSYHTDKNPYLSNSKISLFLKSKVAYKARYIDKTEAPEMTPSLLTGRMVDLAFEKGKVSAIDKAFCSMDLKEYRTSEEKRERVTDTQMENAKAMATKILGSELYKDLKKRKCKFQQVFIDSKLNYAGLLDCLVIDNENKSIEIFDLKTSAVMAMKSSRSYYFHCLEYRYMAQLASYKHLVQLAYPDYKISCYHITIGSGDYYPVKIWKFDDEIIDREWPFTEMIIEQIKNCTDWTDYIPTMENAILLTEPESNGH